ncbi:MAG: tetratricopeptide repeat protein [Microgenomates group bacterium]
MDINLADQAITAALKCDWDLAIRINKSILDKEPDDIDALNRIARAYFESGNSKMAKKESLKALEVEPTNKIAQKALQKYSKNKNGSIGSLDQNIDASDYIEEIGTTKQVSLINKCSNDTVSTLDSGDEATLSTHAHRVTITTLSGKYIGKLPDDLSARLRTLTKNGYKYKVIIKSADSECIKVLIKEIGRGKGFENKQSFPRENSESISEFSA